MPLFISKTHFVMRNISDLTDTDLIKSNKAVFAVLHYNKSMHLQRLKPAERHL